MHPPESWAILCGTYINDCSLAESLRAVGWEGRTVFLKDYGSGPALAGLMGHGVEIWETSLAVPADLICLLQERIPARDSKVIFFTDERFHEAFREESREPRLANARFFVGSVSHLDTILDRYAFYAFLAHHRLAEAPRTLPGSVDPWTQFPHGFFWRFKRSWRGLRKLERVRLVRSRREWDRGLSACRAAGYGEDDWCYQEVLSTAPRDNVSICGWHDRDHPLYVATRKVLQHPARRGNGDVCEAIPPPEGLLATSQRLLEALDYCGPFELEFVRDGGTGTYKVIELNPRFWMQHALVGAMSGQRLVQNYLGRHADSCAVESPAKYWVNTVYALFRLLRGDLRILPYLGTKAAVRVPAWGVALRWLPRYAWRRVRPHNRRSNGKRAGQTAQGTSTARE